MRLITHTMTVMTMIACMGPDEETLVDELRVMAIQAEPAEVQLRDFVPDENGESNTPIINIVIGDPLKTGYQLAVWPCTNIGEGCEERKVFEDAPGDWIQIVEGTESLVTVPVVNNPLWGALLAQSPRPDVPIAITSIFALACEPSVCTELQDALNGDWNIERFSNPFDWIAELPTTGTSMAIKQLPVSNGLSDETRLKNPTMTPTWASDTPIVTTVDAPLTLSFEITLFQQDPDVASIFGYTTRGGFDRNVFANNGLKMADLEPAERSVNWYAAEDTELGEAELFVIVEDGLGGTGFWLGEGTVE
jgi:hypothetical protein